MFIIANGVVIGIYQLDVKLLNVNEKLSIKMKKLFFALLCLFFTSCDLLESDVTFKVIGQGKFSVSVLDADGSSTFTTNQTEFKRQFSDGEIYVLSAHSLDGRGVKVEAYTHGNLINSRYSSGYGVASISGTY